MAVNPVKSILNKLKNNEISAEEAEKLLLNNLSESIGSATIDHARTIFKEFPEVIFAEGKELEESGGSDQGRQDVPPRCFTQFCCHQSWSTKVQTVPARSL